LKSSTAHAYGSRIRAFFRTRGTVEPETVTGAELIAYLETLPRTARKQAAPALDGFFAYLTECGHLVRHPAYALSKRVSARMRQDEMRDALVRAGSTPKKADALLWRDVALDAFGGAVRLPPRLDTNVREELTELLLDKLRQSSPATLAALLEQRILDPSVPQEA
jgi:hypothetical protein